METENLADIDHNRREVFADRVPPAWYIEDPEIFEEDDPRYLCCCCRHIDFALMTNKGQSSYANCPDANLGPVKDIIQKQKCSFCRLIVQSVCIATRSDRPPIDLRGEPVSYRLRRQPPMHENSICDLLLIMTPWPPLGPHYGNCRIHILGDASFEGRRITVDQADFQLIKETLRSCENGTSDLLLHRGESRLSIATFRVIDMADKCIRKIPQRGCRYVALSYVWGGVQQLLLQEANREELERTNSLIKHQALVPQTIKDAITLASQIGERYIWVDALCIIQDDEVSKQAQMTSMDRIYSEAVLTIANAAGTSADADIPGVRPGTRSVRQHVEEIQGSKFSNSLSDIVGLVTISKWDSRAWTYQEKVLSNRLLVMTDQGMYFACDHDIVSEDLNNIHNTFNTKQSSRFKCPIQLSQNGNLCLINIPAYSHALSNYTSRSLTYQSDMLHAFSGIIARLKPLFRGEFIYGLPETELDNAILWRSYGMLVRNVDSATGKVLYPSWSWAGWIGSGGKALRSEEMLLSRIMWKDFAVNEGPNQYFSSTQCRSSCAEKTTFAPKWMATGIYYYEEGRPGILFQHPIASAVDRKARQWFRSPDSYHLEFRTLTAALYLNGLHIWRYNYLGEGRHICAQETCTIHVFDKNGHIAGEVCVPGKILQTMNPGKYDFLLLSRSDSSLSHTFSNPKSDLQFLSDNFPITFDESDKFATISETVLSEKDEHETESEVHAQLFSRPYSSWEDAEYVFDKNHFDRETKWCIYNVMLVEWTDGMAYRVGVGRVHIDAFFEAKPRWKHVILG